VSSLAAGHLALVPQLKAEPERLGAGDLPRILNERCGCTPRAA